MAMKNATDKKSRTENSRKKSAKKATIKSPDELLTGWPAIAKFLGQPVAVAERWAKDGMPVERKGRYMTASPEKLSRWLARQAGTKEPVHIAQGTESDLLEDLRRGLKHARAKKREK